ncbi:yciV [Escherichia coli O25b:H4]|uniref:YciV n=1 Tax=Escherichia coli O25b:H4 TaxID=941280 RepID=A0A192CNU7_ECO25|nr:yciV [Escherichia coli O25b:H4]
MSDTNYSVIYDLHSHTTASDGCLTPEALGAPCQSRCASAPWRSPTMTPQLQLHQQERKFHVRGLALNLIPGVEISTVWENHEIHIVGLNIDIYSSANV